ncbi:MAG: twin-arginine translocase TatA/TatE family subunit [Deltaproteobacteria bacterium]|nr:twin-arginine translocase TatA/TatE family subunit [Deltaproteobacteria bacterium]
MISLLNFGSIGWGEWGVIFVIALLVFGSKRLPVIARQAGRAIRQFQHGMKELTDEIKKKD